MDVLSRLNFKLVERDLGWALFKKNLKALAKDKPYVKVGVLGGPKNSRPGEGVTNVELALIHEFGSPSNNIPERSFIRAPFHAKRAEYMRMLKTLLAGGLKKKGLEPHKALALVGEKIAADFKKGAPGTPPPNAPSTLRRKLSLTRPGSLGIPKALVDTGRMIASITYAVVRGGKK